VKKERPPERRKTKDRRAVSRSGRRANDPHAEDELVSRLKRINRLTNAFLRAPAGSDEARGLLDRIALELDEVCFPIGREEE
jgi:hypothetical protein